MWHDPNHDGADVNRYHFLHDANFNVVAMTDGTYNVFNVVERYHYSPYGEVTILNGASDADPGVSEWSVDADQTSDIGNEFLFTGRRLDPATGLYQYRERYYHPKMGRFVNRDPIGYLGGMNLYAYVGGMPTGFVDPFGLRKWYFPWERGASWSPARTWDLWSSTTPSGHINGLYTGDTDPDQDVKEAAFGAAGQEYTERSANAHAQLDIIAEFDRTGAVGALNDLARHYEGEELQREAEKYLDPTLGAIRDGLQTAVAVKDVAELGTAGAKWATSKNTCGSRKYQFWEPPCFPPGTEIHLADGSTKPIEEIEVGDRVDGKNPDDTEEVAPDPDPDSWRKVTLRVEKENGRTLELETLRPLAWIEAHKLEPGARLAVDFKELFVAGNAEVLAIEACPTIMPGHGTVVLTTYRHQTSPYSDVHDLILAGDGLAIRTTGNHRFWSVTRQAFIEAKHLEPDERVDTMRGVQRVARIEPVAYEGALFNLETTQHVYRVGVAGVLVHNANDCDEIADALDDAASAAPKKRGPKTDPNAPHNATISGQGDLLEAGGNTVIAGGGRFPERLIPTPGGNKGGRRPDILFETSDGTLRGRNIGKTDRFGNPIKRELEALEDLNGPGGIPTDFVPYD